MRRLHDMLDSVMGQKLLGTSAEEGWGDHIAPIDMYETVENLVVEAAMPGVHPDDIDLSVTEDTLTIRGEVVQVQEGNGKGERSYYLREMRAHRYSRRLNLPTLVEPDKAEAHFEHGVLRLTIPKAPEVRPKRITVKAKK
jgi:HSP20 family protein